MDRDAILATHAVELQPGAGQAGPPDWVKLLPLGTTPTVDGRGPYVVADLAHAQAVVAASTAAGRQLAIDYDHAIDLAAPKGLPAPAAGWMEALEARADGIWARVAWTEKALAALKAREWRFLSPAFLHRKDGRVLQVLRAGLTNDPNITALPALASRQAGLSEGDTMDELLKKIREALGLPEAADAETALAAVKAAKAGADVAKAVAKALGLAETVSAKDVETALAASKTARETIAKAVGLAGDASADDVVKAIAARSGEGGDVAKLQEQILALNKTVTELQAKATVDEATAEVDAAIKAGKINPAARDASLALAKRSIAEFREYVGKLPVTLRPGTEIPAGQVPTGKDGLTDAQLAICKAMGVDPAAYKKTLDGEKEAA